MQRFNNPHSRDADKSAIWEMLVARDIAAFVRADWNLVVNDFIKENFTGIHAQFSNNPDDWTIAFPTLSAYQTEWLKQAQASQKISYAEDLETAIHKATSLKQIDITKDSAMAHKKFNGTIKLSNGTVETLNWQTLYLCRKVSNQWKIKGFIGYMAYLKI